MSKTYLPYNYLVEPQSLRVKGSAQKNKVIKPQLIPTTNNTQTNKHERHVSFDQSQYKRDFRQFDQQVAYTNIPLDPIQGSKPTQVPTLANEYRERQKKMDERLIREIESNSIAHAQPRQQNNLDQDQQDTELQRQPSEQPISFYRSQRSVAMRIKDSYESELQILETDKLQLIQRLNDALLQLDKINQEKSEMSNRLIEQIKFVRDLQRETQKGDDVSGVVNEGLRLDLKREKELNFKLKEDLKRIDLEKMRTLQRLRQFQGDSEDFQNEATDMGVALRTKQVHMQALEDDYRDVIRKVEAYQKDVDHLRAIIIDNQISLDILKESIHQENFNRETHVERVRQIQDRLDGALEKHLRDKHEIHLVQSRQVHLLSAKVLFISLSYALLKRRKQMFQTLKKESVVIHAYKKGLKKCRTLFRKKALFKAKRGFFTWYYNKLKPSKNIKQKENVPTLLGKNNPKALVFGKWIEYLHKEKSEKMKSHQMIAQILKTKCDYNHRMLKLGMDRWRDSIIRTDKGKEYRGKLLKRLFERRINFANQAFLRWVHYCYEVNFAIKMNGMAQRLTLDKYRQVLFYQWRGVTKLEKSMRINRMIRTWKNLKANMQKQKQLKSTMTALLRESYIQKKSLLKICYDAIRSQRRYDKLCSMAIDLTENVRPTIQKCQYVIEHMNDNKKDRSMIHCQETIRKCLGRSLQSYFQKWKKTAEHKDEILFNSVKRQIMIAYKKKLRDGFTAWIAFKGKAMHHSQIQTIELHEEEAHQMQSELTQERNTVKEKRARQQCQSGKSIKKIAIGAFNRMMKTRFNQWRTTIKVKDIKGEGLGRLVKIFDKMKKKEVFKKYYNQVDEVKQEEIFLQKVKDGKFKLDCRMKKRVYDGIREFAYQHTRAKHYLQRMFARLDKSQRKIGFKKWFKFTEFKKENKLMKKDIKILEVVNELKKEEGEYQDECHMLEMKNQELQRDLFHRTRRVINKWFLRSNDVNSKYAFSVWKEYSQIIWAQEQKMKKVINKMCKATTLYAFRFWKERIKHKKFSLIRQDTLREEAKIADTMRLLESNFNKFSRRTESKQHKLKQQKMQQGIFYAKQQNCLDALIDRKNLYFCMPKEHYILKKWHEHTMNRKHAFHYFGKILNKVSFYEGFQIIKNFYVEKKFSQKRKDTVKRIMKLTKKFKSKLSWRKWKNAIYQNVIQQSLYLDGENQCVEIVRRKFLKSANTRNIAQYTYHYGYVRMANCLRKFKAYAQKKTLLKQKVKTYKLNIRHTRRKSALELWSGRLETTKKVLNAAEKINKIYKGSNKVRVFAEWKAYHNRLKHFLRKFSQFESKVDRIYKMICMQKIKGRAHIVQDKIDKKIAKARKNGKKFLHFLIYERLRNAFRKYRDRVFQLRREDATKRIMIQNWLIHDKRNYFKQWKLNAQKIEVVQFNKEEGPTVVETSKLRGEYFALRQKLIDDGYTEDDIERHVEQCKERDLGLLKKGLARIQCYNDELRQLPYLFDQWKAWVIERKRFKYWINHMNKRCNHKTSYLQIAFDQWRSSRDTRSENLVKKTKEQLVQYGNKNYNKLEKLLDNEFEKEQNISDLTSQRDILLRSYVGSQRLALANSQAGFQKTTLKAFVRMTENNDEAKISIYERQLEQNLKQLQGLKDAIKKYEWSNQQIADQNDALKAGAMEGIEMAKSFESLSNDREKLSMDIADKAITIRKLLEDNQNLSIRLNQAQEDAIKLIKATQQSLSYSNHKGYGVA